MSNCPFCNAEIEPNSRFCIYCMTPLTTKEKIKTQKPINTRWLFYLAAALAFVIVFGGSFTILKNNSHSNTPSETANNNQPRTPSIIEVQSEVDNTSHTVLSSSNSSTASSKTNTTSGKKQTSSITSSKTASTQQSVSVSSEPKPDNPFLYRLKNNEIYIEGSNEKLKGDIKIPNTINGYTVTRICAMAFFDYSEITSLTFPSGVKSIEDNAFQNCYALKSITFTEGLQKILCGAFAECVNLEKVVLPNSLTELQTWAFLGCKNLTDVTIPKSITTIQEGVFKDCKKLKNVYYRGTKKDIQNMIICSDNDPLQSATWHFEN